MPRIVFYILSNDSANGRSLLACRLAEKAYNLGHKVYIHTAQEQQAQALDDLLWTFRDGSFVPHTLERADADELSPIAIGWSEDIGSGAEVLINLAPSVPAFFNRFERVIEVVNQDSEILRQSRQRFRFYREQGLEPESHKL